MTAERLRSLYELIGRMNSVYELNDLLEFVVDRALSLTGGRRGLLLLDDDRDQKMLDIAVARGEELQERHLEQALDFVSTTVIKDVLDRGEPRLVADLTVDERYEGLASEATARFKQVRSVLAVPLKIETQLVGLVYIDHPQRAVFGQSDLDFLRAFATQAAIAINRTRQHQRQVEELTLLNELSRSVVRVLDLDEVLARIVDEAIRMLNVETGSVLLLKPESSELTFDVSVSQSQRVEILASLKVGQGIAGWVAIHGKVACVNDVSQDERWYGEVEAGFKTRSVLCVPLVLDDRVLGVLQVLNKKNDGFNDSDIMLLSAFAGSATVAIENARLFQEASQARQLRVLNEVALTVSSTLDLEAILRAGLEKSLEILRADGGAITLINAHQEAVTFKVKVSGGFWEAQALDDAQQETLAQLSNFILQSEEDKTLVVNQPELESIPGGALLAAAGIQTLALAPLKVGENIRAMVAIGHSLAHTYSTEEISTLVGLARIIGLAVQNASFYNQMKSQTMQLTYLNEVGAVLTSSLDLDHILQIIIQGVNTLLETERTSVFLIEEETNALVLRYSNQEEPEIRLAAPWQGIAGWVATNDKPALVNNTYSDPRFLRQVAKETGYEAQSILCVPLKIEGKVIGVVQALNKIDDGDFTYEHQALLIELTRWAAIAIQNARLYHARLYEQELRIAAETRGAMAAVTLNMAHTMNNVVGAIRAWATSLEYTATSMPQAPLSQVHDKLRQIRKNAEEAIELIRNIRAPLEPIEPGATDARICIDQAISRCWWPDDVTVQFTPPGDLPLVWANAEGLEAVIHNLISNAVQALASTGGEIRIETARPTAEQVEIKIIDNGPGIPSDLQERIFQPGVSGREERLGIGLWLVETFIRRFEGHIDFASMSGSGTSFSIWLKVAPLEE